MTIWYVVFLIYSIGVIVSGISIFSDDELVQEFKELIEEKLDGISDADDEMYNVASKILYAIVYVMILGFCLVWPYNLIKTFIKIIKNEDD